MSDLVERLLNKANVMGLAGVDELDAANEIRRLTAGLQALQAKLDEAGAENARLRARAAGLEKALLKAGGRIITYTLPRVGTPETGDGQ